MRRRHAYSAALCTAAATIAIPLSATPAAAYEAALFATVPGAHVFTLAGEIASVDTVIGQISALAPGARLDASGPPLPIATEFPDDPALGRLLPGLPATSLEEGLRQTIAFYRTRQ